MAEVLLEALEEIYPNQPLTAAHEVHDFEGVVRLDVCLLPASAREDIKIPLDGNAIARHAQVPEKRSDVEAFGDFAAFAVDRDSHVRWNLYPR